MEINWEYGMPELQTMCLFKLRMIPPRKIEIHEELKSTVDVTDQPAVFTSGALSKKRVYLNSDFKHPKLEWSREFNSYEDACNKQYTPHTYKYNQYNRKEYVSFNWGQYYPIYICFGEVLLSRCGVNICINEEKMACSVCEDRIKMFQEKYEYKRKNSIIDQQFNLTNIRFQLVFGVTKDRKTYRKLLEETLNKIESLEISLKEFKERINRQNMSYRNDT